MIDAERRARGERMYREVTQTPAFSPPDAYVAATVDLVFGEVWTRPGLTRKERRFITLSCVGASGAAGAMEYHLRAALVSGDITREEMVEFILHFAFYGGWPASSSLYSAYAKLCAELDAAKSADER
jgi:4-carboxymuconolactone decarboxylase